MGSVIGGLGAGLVGLLVSDVKSLRAYDFFNEYIDFPAEATNVIDDLLMRPRHGRVSSLILLSPSSQIPGEGVHILYEDVKGSRLRYVVLTKERKTVNNREVWSYSGKIRIWSSWAGVSAPSVSALVFRPEVDEGKVMTMHLDVSGFDPVINAKPKTLGTAWPNQQRICAHIIREYKDSPKRNVRYLLSGKGEIGKSYTATFVKQALQTLVPGCEALLYDDLNPSAKGLDLSSVVLTRASSKSPLVLVMDEFDLAVEEALREKMGGYDRFSHTQSKTTLNAMMDAIERTPFVVAIFTSEKPVNYFVEDSQRATFTRKGRIDWFVEMTRDSETFIPAKSVWEDH